MLIPTIGRKMGFYPLGDLEQLNFLPGAPRLFELCDFLRIFKLTPRC